MLSDRSAHRWLAMWLATSCVWGSAFAGSSAQEPRPEQAPPSKIGASGAPASDPHDEIRKLLGQVEVRLREIDRLLSDAAESSPRAREQSAPAGIDEFLTQSGDRSRQVVEDFDRILELLDHPHPPGGS